MFCSIDVGNDSIKIRGKDTKLSFKATVDKKVMLLNNEVIPVVYNNTTYTIGNNESSNQIIGCDKYSKVEHDILLFTAICSLYEKIERTNNVGVDTPNKGNTIINANIVVGLPVELFLKESANYQQYLLKYRNQPTKIQVGSKTYTIILNNILVFPQGAIIFNDTFRDTTVSTLVAIDIGGGSVDISYWRDKNLCDAKSILKGCNDIIHTVRDKIIKKVSERFSICNISYREVETLFLQGKDTITIFGEEIDISDVKAEVLEAFTKEVVSTINSTFSNISSAQCIALLGGGSNMLEDNFKKYYPNLKTFSDVYTNADTYYTVGLQYEFDKEIK